MILWKYRTSRCDCLLGDFPCGLCLFMDRCYLPVLSFVDLSFMAFLSTLRTNVLDNGIGRIFLSKM